jgi:hypothetical protein
MSAEEPLNPTNARGPNQGTEITQTMSPDETAGAVIGRYHLLQKIGEGSHAAGVRLNPAAIDGWIRGHARLRGRGRL